MADQSESHFVRQCLLEMERENICRNLNAMEGKKKKRFYLFFSTEEEKQSLGNCSEMKLSLQENLDMNQQIC